MPIFVIDTDTKTVKEFRDQARLKQEYGETQLQIRTPTGGSVRLHRILYEGQDVIGIVYGGFAGYIKFTSNGEWTYHCTTGNTPHHIVTQHLTGGQMQPFFTAATEQAGG